MQGIGQLTIANQSGATIAAYSLREGSGVTSTVGALSFQFVLDRAPLPSEFDIREMSAVRIAKYLGDRLDEEATANLEAADRWED